MSKEFENVVNLYQPSGKDIREKDDPSDHPRDPYANLDLLPLAKLCPQLGEVIPVKGSSPDGPQRCC